MSEQEQAQENLSKVAQNLPLKNHIEIINGKIIFRASDVFKSMGIDYVG